MADLSNLFVVRLFDGFDFEWMDVSEPLPREEADALCLAKNGGKPKSYKDIDYYAVYPADTKMRFS